MVKVTGSNRGSDTGHTDKNVRGLPQPVQANASKCKTQPHKRIRPKPSTKQSLYLPHFDIINVNSRREMQTASHKYIFIVFVCLLHVSAYVKPSSGNYKYLKKDNLPVPVAVRSKAYVCGRSLAEIVG
jgi:hypothetical protein